MSTSNDLTKEQNEKVQKAKLALAQIFTMCFAIICGFIFQELELKQFAYFGGWGWIFGFVVGLLALLGEDWTKTATLTSLKRAARPCKYMMIFFAVSCVLVGVFVVAIKTQLIIVTPNGIMHNLHYYYFSPSPEYFEQVLSVLIPWLFLAFATSYFFNMIRETDFFKKFFSYEKK